MKNKKIFFSSVIFFGSLFWSSSASAVCAVCAVAVGAGVGLSRWLGIDDAITGLWIGALTVSLILWTIDWMERKNWRFRFRNAAVFLAYVGFIVVPLYFTGIMGHPQNVLWGIDKLLLGIALGAAVFSLTAFGYEKMKKNNSGRAYFPFQKVAMPLGALIFLSGFFYLLTR